MNTTTTLNKVLWAAGTAAVALMLAFFFHIPAPSVPHALGTTGSGITNLTGLSITGIPGTFDASGPVNLVGSTTFSGGLADGTSVGMIPTAVRSVFTSGTSTPCGITSPNATTTLMSFSMNITTATSSTIDWSFGTSTSLFATSSSMVKNQRIPAGQFGTVMWDPGINTGLIPPLTPILIGPDTGTVNTTGAFNSIVIGGSCQGLFLSAN